MLTKFGIHDQNPCFLPLSSIALHEHAANVGCGWLTDRKTRQRVKTMMRMVKTKGPRAVMLFHKGTTVGTLESSLSGGDSVDRRNGVYSGNRVSRPDSGKMVVRLGEHSGVEHGCRASCRATLNPSEWNGPLGS